MIGTELADTMSDAIPQGQLEFDDLAERMDAGDYDVSLLALSQIRGLGHKTLRQLDIAYEGELWRVWTTDSSQLHQTLTAVHAKAPEELVETVCSNAPMLLAKGREKRKQLIERGVQIIQHQELPESLRQLPGGPRWLFLEGERKTLYETPVIAVVGTRAATHQGVRSTNRVLRTIAAYPVVVVSGLAEGIDAACHRASLIQGVPNVAVLGHGIDTYFPASTKELREGLVQAGGAVVTEYLPAEPYRKEQFVARNRLQAALADMVIPVEGGATGGTAHTVRFARELNRPLVGVRWEGADSFASHSDRGVALIVDAQSESDWARFDAAVRALVDKYGKDSYAFSRVERILIGEYQSRAVRLEDIERLRTRLKKMAREIRNVHSSASGDIQS